VVLLAAFFCYEEMKRGIAAHQADQIYFSKVLVSFFVIIYASHVLSSWCGQFVENAIDSWSALSYLKFNKGDEVEIRNYERTNRNSIIKTFLGILSTIGVSVMGKIAASLISTHFIGQ
jgi:hypothetical protein